MHVGGCACVYVCVSVGFDVCVHVRWYGREVGLRAGAS